MSRVSETNSVPTAKAGVSENMETGRMPVLRDAQLYADIMGFLGRAKFRGEIWECYKDVPMERGFSNQGKPFDIESACYLKAPQRAIRQRPYGKFVFKAAVQMLKTNGTIEQPAGYFILYDPADMIIYLPADEAAFDQAKARLMPFLKSVPGVGAIVDEAERQNRFDITTAEFYLPGMVLRVWPLNKGTTQRMTLRYVMISDAFLSGTTGLLDQAIRRTTQHNTKLLKDYKIIIESQGSDLGDDFDVEWKSTNQGMLHVVCPNCAKGQPFDWHRVRPEDFRATAPKSVPSLDRQAWEDHYSPLLRSEERKSCGMKRGDEAMIKREDGSYNEQEILKQTYYECFYCGSAWQDTPATRLELDQSSYYVPANPNALEENIGFSWSSWAGQRLPWGGEQNMLGYLRAKEVLDRFGNPEKLKQWYQKSAAQTWDPNIILPDKTISVGSYEVDPAKLMPDFHSRNLTVDSQKDPTAGPNEDRVGSFWYVVRQWDKFGNSRQDARGFCASWEELIAVQKFWKIPNGRVGIDSSKWTPMIRARALLEYEMVTPPKAHLLTGRRDPYPSCWQLFFGDTRQRFVVKGKASPYVVNFSPTPYSVQGRAGAAEAGRWLVIRPLLCRWSNFDFENQLEAILAKAPGMPRFEVLARELLPAETQQKETGILTYDQQMSARYLAGAGARQKWEDVKNRKAHYRDCELMQLVRAAQDGLLGHVSAG